MKTAPMVRWLYPGLLGVMVVLSAVCIILGCRKEEEGGAASVAQRGPSFPPFTPRSLSLLEDVVHRTPTLGPRQSEDENEEEVGAVSVSVHAVPASGGAPLTVNFSAEVSHAPADAQYGWDFGDHSQPSGRLVVQHTYTGAGEYTATFRVIGRGVSESQAVDVKVTEEGFDLDAYANPDIGVAPLRVEFVVMLDDELPQPVSFQWDFGDGSQGDGNPTDHIYPDPGQYTATLLVTNGLGQIARRELEVQVDPHGEEEQ